MAKVDQPHFDYPFRFSKIGGHAVVNEQDSEEDILACCLAIIKTPLGFRDEQPDFGVGELIFTDGPIDTNEIRVALDMWEERASYLLSESNLTPDQLVRYVRVQLEARNG